MYLNVEQVRFGSRLRPMKMSKQLVRTSKFRPC